ncbi:putative type III polyketide synthase [Cercophora newfieldiana]|uniref:Type III polyketide synthase n=1 Tax=Cercophora newfieldiana TaxID=92897 RepID=A0AA40CKY9_9PEZI|nr:putative type III polyketide synthase [Cercophora newfieldiana]
MASSTERRELGLSIIGLGTQYPPFSLPTSVLDALSKKFYPDSPAMQKVLSINRYTGIDQRSSIGTPDHPLVNGPTAPTITEINKIFMSDGVPLAVSAARQALAEARVEPTQITHMVSTTCTNSANPGYDHFVARDLGLSRSVEKVLLHGIGCSGGLAALRTAANLCLGHAMRGLPARILVVALEISTTLVRSELDSINADQETRIGIALFSDCAGALVLSNGLGTADEALAPPVYELLGWEHHTIPDTESDLGFDVDPLGWKVVLTPRVPTLTQGVLEPAYKALLDALPRPPPETYRTAADYDWAMHPGGATILTGAEKALRITPEHMRASYDTYINHGNSSSATIISVLNRLRSKEMDAMTPDSRGPRDHVVGCAFGPGISVEMCMLRRNLAASSSGLQTPPETESEPSEAGAPASENGDDQASELDEATGTNATGGNKPVIECSGGDTTGNGERLETAKQADAFISEALESVELD